MHPPDRFCRVVPSQLGLQRARLRGLCDQYGGLFDCWAGVSSAAGKAVGLFQIEREAQKPSRDALEEAYHDGGAVYVPIDFWLDSEQPIEW